MKFLQILDKALYGFILLFMLFYIGKFGITNLVLPATSTWQVIFNICLWFIVMSVCIKELFPEPEEKKKVRWAK